MTTTAEDLKVTFVVGSAINTGNYMVKLEVRRYDATLITSPAIRFRHSTADQLAAPAD